MQSSVLSSITPPLLYWYGVNKRDLPWRRCADPYRVWISEIMLQQTRVEAVIPYYERFLAACPTVLDLARIEDEKLMKLWEGLGYYSRARNLKKAAIQIVSSYGGTLPRDYDALLSLPGIGPYTAGAIASIAMGLPVPAVDGNVLRVVSRLLSIPEDVTGNGVKKQITSSLADVYPTQGEECSMMTQALMELGATVCIPNGAPRCDVCPLSHLCTAYGNGNPTDFPIKPKRKERRTEKLTVLLIKCGDKYAIRKRGEKGLLASLNEFPNYAGHLSLSRVREALSLPLDATVTPLADARHIFTHIEWDMKGYLVEIKEEINGLRFVTPDEIANTYAVASAFSAYLSILFQNKENQTK